MISNEKPVSGTSGVLARVGRTGVGLVLLGSTFLLACEARSQPKLPWTEPAKKTVVEWRQQFPFVPLGGRLDYEAKHAQEQPLPPALTAEAKKKLETADQLETPDSLHHLRIEALEKLHSQEAEEFVKREGFGRMRMPLPSWRDFELPVAPTIPQGTVGYPESLLEEDSPVTLPVAHAKEASPSRLPSIHGLNHLHGFSRSSFLNPNSFGLVKDRNQVAGFEPHQFRFNPANSVYSPELRSNVTEMEHWVMRLELVSVWKFDKPAVYVTAQLPRMQDVANAPRRDLSDFEAKALKRLQAGEDVVTEATTNRIRMLGALRASKQCLDCHSVQHGELLGSFSYELLRDPPLLAR